MKILIEITAIFIIPVLLVYFHIAPLNLRFPLVGISALAVLLIVVSEKWSLKELGIRGDNIKKCCIPYFLFSAAGSLAIVIFAHTLGNRHTAQYLDNFAQIIIPLAFIQEFGYRGFLIPRLKKAISSPFILIVANAAIFAFLHIIFPNQLINISLTFIGGLGFAALYFKYPNLILISISHAILDFFALMYGFVSFTN